LTNNPNWVEIVKTGNDYTFFYKENELDFRQRESRQPGVCQAIVRTLIIALPQRKA